MRETTTLRMTKRSRNGPRCRKYHAVPNGPRAARAALCGTSPVIGFPKADGGIRGAKGWGSVAGRDVTCTRCLAALARAEV